MVLVQPKGTANGNGDQGTVPEVFEFSVDEFEK